MTRIKLAIRDFSVSALDQAVVERLYDDWSEEGSEGMRVFLDEWAEGLTFDTAKVVIEDFGFQDKFGDPADLETRYTQVDQLFDDLESALDDGPVKSINERSELVTPDGPRYRAGRDGLRFGLIFEASLSDLEELRKRFPVAVPANAQAAAGHNLWCAQRALSLLKSLDFGHADDSDIRILEHADDMLTACGLPDQDLKLAIRLFLTDRNKAHAYIHGTSSGAIAGTLNSLTKLVNPASVTEASVMDALMPSSKYIKFRGAVYERVDEQPRQKKAYYLPEDIKGVTTCKAKDVKDKGKDIWCVYDWKGRLRGRFKNKKDAVRHKVLMIRRFLGSDKAKRQKKYRPPND